MVLTTRMVNRALKACGTRTHIRLRRHRRLPIVVRFVDDRGALEESTSFADIQEAVRWLVWGSGYYDLPREWVD